MKYNFTTGLLLVTTMMFFTKATSLADVLDGEPQSIEANSVHELVGIVLGHDQPIWKSKGKRWISDGEVLSQNATLVYTPFRSSASFCRTYVTTIHSPGWVCDGNLCPDASVKAYDIKTTPFLSEAPKEEGTSCIDLDFESDYFALENDLHDDQVVELLMHFRRSLTDWKKSEVEKQEGLNCKEISARNIISIEILPRGEVALARFLLQHPQSDTSRLVFELEIEDSEVTGYSMDEMMP